MSPIIPNVHNPSLQVLQGKFLNGQGFVVGLEDELPRNALGTRQYSAKDAGANQNPN